MACDVQVLWDKRFVLFHQMHESKRAELWQKHFVFHISLDLESEKLRGILHLGLPSFLPSFLPLPPSLSLSFLIIYLFLRERTCCVHRWVREGQREGETDSQAGSTLPAQSPTWGSNSQTVRSWPEPKSRVGRLTDGATQVHLANPLLIKALCGRYSKNPVNSSDKCKICTVCTSGYGGAMGFKQGFKKHRLDIPSVLGCDFSWLWIATLPCHLLKHSLPGILFVCVCEWSPLTDSWRTRVLSCTLWLGP